jgi:hypothetical protein
MESRNFIRIATTLRQEIADFTKANLSPEETQVQGGALQKDITAAFSGLQNPTLPSAEKLRDEALAAGFFVNPAVSQRIHQANSVWPN